MKGQQEKIPQCNWLPILEKMASMKEIFCVRRKRSPQHTPTIVIMYKHPIFTAHVEVVWTAHCHNQTFPLYCIIHDSDFGLSISIETEIIPTPWPPWLLTCLYFLQKPSLPGVVLHQSAGRSYGVYIFSKNSLQVESLHGKEVSMTSCFV